jgi:SAM-dependent methyltransferase
VLLAKPGAYLESCRRQLALVERHAARTIAAIEDQLQRRDVLDLTRTRCRALVEAVRDQAGGIRSILEPVLGKVAASSNPLPDEAPAPLRYIQYLYRDWGRQPEPDGENEKALAAVEAVLGGAPIGKTLVLGAGACRLAYDLTVRDSTAQTIALDIDAFLFTAADTVIRGGSITLREANAEVNEVDHVSRAWELRAPRGPLEDDRFALVLADGRDPPFAAAVFDTVLTPWFIDVVPADLRDLVSAIHRLLKPGGRWLNLGPFRYRPEAPATLRFAREEVFELAERAGFRIEKWRSESMPYLVSKLNGRGTMEWVLAFSASKTGSPLGERTGPPAWLLFRHLPVPTFSGQQFFFTEDAATQIVISSIDGKRTLDDITQLLASQAGDAGLTMEQFREVVRRCLSEAHPDCAH